VRRVLVITNNLDQASFRVRMSVLVGPLRARGIDLDVHVRPRGMRARRRLLRTASSYDAVVLQRKFLDPGDARLLQRASRKIIYDIDDALMFQQKPAGLIERWRTRRRFTATANVVDVVVAGNEYLADIFRQRGSETIVLPTVVDVSRYAIKRHVQTDTPRLVWIGSRSTLGYLNLIYPALAAARRTLPGLRLVVIADAAPVDAPLPVDFVRWSESTESQSLAGGDIGIAPTPDDAWTRGKCGFKIVQYLATGLPVIASPVGANTTLVQPSVTGFLPASQDQWTSAVLQLAGDASMRELMGQRGRALAEESLSLERALDVWERLLA